VEQLAARWAHNPKVVGSSPTPATTKRSLMGPFYILGRFMVFYVYLIISEEGYHYTGQTPDLLRRVMEHNSGICHSTKHGHNWRVVYSEEFPTRGEAMKREKWLKSGVGRRWIDTNIAGWSPP
jgi:putative endonuclease